MEALLGLLGLAVWIANVVCLIMVVTKLFKDKGVGWGIFGVICSIYTFIWGWQNANRFDMKNLMLIWTFLFVALIILRVVTTVMMAGTSVPAN
jgi:hypothetical protein